MTEDRQRYLAMAKARGMTHDQIVAAVKLHRERTGDSLHEALEAIATGRMATRLSYVELVKQLEIAIAWIEEESNEYKPTAAEILPQLRDALARARS